MPSIITKGAMSASAFGFAGNAVTKKGIFVGVSGSSSSICYSYDGINWTLVNNAMPGNSWHSVAFGNGVFVAVSANNSGSAYSYDGIHWYAATLASNMWVGVKFVGGIFITGGQNNYYATSTDGINWTLTFNSNVGYDFAYAYGAIWTPTGTGAIIKSTDGGNTWSAAITMANIGNMNISIAYDPISGKLVGTSYNGFAAAYSTNGGATWYNSANANAIAANGEFLTCVNGVFLAADYQSTTIARSTDGNTWASVSLFPCYTFAAGNGIVVAIEYNSFITAYSTDNGLTWTTNTVGTHLNSQWTGVCFGTVAA